MNRQKPLVLITGHTGMLGSAIMQQLNDTYSIISLKRNRSNDQNPTWNYAEVLQQTNNQAPYAVIHLAGAGIANKRWNDSYKEVIYNSRVNGTNWLVKTINQHELKPEVFMCASAIGFYGHRPNETLNEQSPMGGNFVAEIASAWEAASQQLDSSKTRLINLRFGMILDASGGALKDMVMPFKLCLGGKLGKGTQQYSWIGLKDAIRAIDFLLQQKQATGIYNLTTENPVSNAEFTKTLAKTLNRPAFFHMPESVVRLAFGEVADELLLADAHVLPQRLIELGFQFSHPKIAPALAAALS